MPPAIAKTPTQEFIERVAPLLGDHSVHIPELDLRRWLSEAKHLEAKANDHALAHLLNIEGYIYRRQEKHEQARAMYAKARWHDSTRADLVNNEGTALLALGRLEDALRRFREAATKPVKDKRTDGIIAGNIAETLYRLGRRDEAEAAFEKAVVSHDPADPVDLFWLAESASYMDNWQDAAEFFARYLAARRGVERGHEPPVPFIRRMPDDLKTPLDHNAQIAAVIQRAMDQWDAPIPPEHQINATVDVDHAGWETFCELAGLPVEG